MEPDFVSDCTSISIPSTLIKDSKFKKHVTYCIIGRDANGDFQIQRRYKEFNALRSSLTASWPGCYIPMIPPKKMIGNLEAEFIETRQKLLEYFLEKTSEISYLYSSDEFQLFIRGPEDYIKALSSLKKITISEIGEKYQSVFKIFPSEESYEEQSIIDSENYFKFSLSKLESFENICKRNIFNFDIFNKHLDKSCNGLNVIIDQYKSYGQTLEKVPVRGDSINPFRKVLKWVQLEILNFQAILDVVTQKNEVTKVKLKYLERVDNEQKSLSKAQSGKKSLSQRFSKKTNDEYLAEIDSELQGFIKESETVKLLEKIIVDRIVKVYLPNFKRLQSEGFGSMINNYIEVSNLDTDSMLNHSEIISRVFS